jgi:hypothetical protein
MVFEKNNYKTKKNFDDMAFLARAVSDDETRFFMHFIHVETENENVYCVSTEGRILHIVEYTKDEIELEDGHYRVTNNKKDIIVLEKENEKINFPNWKRILGTVQDHICIVDNFFLTLEGLKDKTKAHDYYEFLFILNNLGYCFNHTYLQSIAMMNRNWSVYLSPYKQCAAMKFISGNKTAIIMPYTDDIVKGMVATVANAFEKLDTTLREVNKTSTLFNMESIVRKKKWLWD